MNGPITDRGLLRAALAFAAALFVLFLAWRFLAGIATVALSGPVEWLHRRKVPRAVAAVSIILGLLVALVLVGYLFLPVLVRQAAQLVSALPFTLDRAVGFLGRLAGGIGLPFGGEDSPSLSALADLGRRVVGGALGLFGSLATLVFGLVVCVTVPLYLAASPGPVVAWTLRLFPPERRTRAREVLSELRRGLLSWLAGRILAMTFVGVLWTVALYVIGIPGALFLGILAGVLGFVPYVGPILSAVPPILISLAGDPIDAVWVMFSYLAIQQVEGYLLKPLIEGKTASLHPAVVIATVVAAGAAFGFLGALLAVPATVVAKVLMEELWFRRLEEGPEEPEVGPAR